MIWGYDYSVQLLVNLVLLVIIFSIVFIRRYNERKKHQNEDDTSENQT